LFTAVPLSSVSAQVPIPVAQLTTALPTLPLGLLVTTQTPSAIVTGPFQAGDTLTVTGLVGQNPVGHESETGPRITTPNGGGDGLESELPVPNVQMEKDEGAPGADLIWPMLNPDGADPVLNFQPGRFEDSADNETASTASDNEVVQAGLPWWSVVLLAAGSLAAGSLAAKPRVPGRKEHPLGNPDESSR